MLTFDQIKELIELVGERRLQGVRIERSGFRLEIEGQAPPPAAAPAPPEAAVAAAPAAPATAPEPEEEPEEEGHPEGTHILTSPIVGTFYAAPSPDSDPYVKVGSRVEKGQVLCIVEAMKLMNEIESDVDGEVLEVFPKNGQPVEFGEQLFAIEPD